MIAKHIAEHHLRDALHAAIQRIVPGGTVDDVGREGQFVSLLLERAVFLHVVDDLKRVREFLFVVIVLSRSSSKAF